MRIAGLVAAEGTAPAERLRAMLERARTGAGGTAVSLAEGRAAFGAVGPHRPSVTLSDGLLVAIDGCVYNRAELEGAGAAGDAALVASLCRKHGFDGAVARLNGDFALAVHDPGEGITWLARDCFGVRPLYWTLRHGEIAFASRPRALLGQPGMSNAVNRAFVALFAGSHYRTFDNDPESSPYAEVAQLPAAHRLRVTAGGDVSLMRYWDLADAPDLELDEDALAERYRELLADAVRLRLGRAQRPAFTLSGGLDSSSVLVLAAESAGRGQEAYSAVYRDETYDESAEIATMMGAAVSAWHPVPVDRPDVFALIARLIAAHDEPVATATWLSHYLVSERVRADGFRELYGGLGGDELNAGEYEYFLFHFADLRAAGDEETLAHEVEQWARHHDHPVFRKSREVVERGLERLIDPAVPGRCRPDRVRLGRYVDAVLPDYYDLRGFEPAMDAPFRSYLKNRAYQDLFRETLPCCLRAADRHAAELGLDAVWPFLDHRLAELLFRVPGTMKIRDGVTKQLLRRAMRGLLPEATRTRIKKTGWNAPAHLWFSGAGRDVLLDLIASRSFRERGIYDLARVRALIDEHERIVASGEAAENHMMFLWQLVNLELWLRSLDAGAA